MIQLKTSGSAPIWVRSGKLLVSAIDTAAHFIRTHAVGILRLLILVLVGLLFILAGLVLLTGKVEIGVPILAGVLFSGFSAAQFSR
jgi:hypothetical protein